MKHSLAAILCLCLVASCNNSVTVTTDPGGSYRGKVLSYDVDGNLSATLAGATVQIEGTTLSATTNDTGGFILGNVPAGIYNVLITRLGFDTQVIANDPFSGAGAQFLPNAEIQKIPSDSFAILSTQIVVDSLNGYFGDTVFGLRLVTKLLGPDSMKLRIFKSSLDTVSGNELSRTDSIHSDGSYTYVLYPPHFKHGSYINVALRPVAIHPGDYYPYPYSGTVSPFITRMRLYFP